MTIFCPCTLGVNDTRYSTRRLSNRHEKCPSWIASRAADCIWQIVLTTPWNSSATFFGSSQIQTIVPSTRIRQWNPSPLGSRWTSVARVRLAILSTFLAALGPDPAPDNASDACPRASISSMLSSPSARCANERRISRTSSIQGASSESIESAPVARRLDCSAAPSSRFSTRNESLPIEITSSGVSTDSVTFMSLSFVPFRLPRSRRR